MIAPEGTGVFFAHFMGSMLHSPVAVIYGERLVATAIAAEGDRVVVAYEEPNGTRQQVDVAMSHDAGASLRLARHGIARHRRRVGAGGRARRQDAGGVVGDAPADGHRRARASFAWDGCR